MHLWLVTSSYPTEPAESRNAGVLARDLALELVGRGHRVTILTPRKSRPIRWDPELEGIVLPALRGVDELAHLDPRRLFDWLTLASLVLLARYRLPRWARRSRPDGALALWGLPSGLFARWALRPLGRPYAVWLLGSDVWKAARYPLGPRLLRQALRDSCAAFADGVELARAATDLTGHSVEFLPSVRRLPPAGDPALPGDLLFVGRFHPHKGPDVLLEALALLRRAEPGARLRMYGDGPLREALERRCQESDLSGSVELAGPIGAAEFAAELAACKLLVIPSRIESIPLVLGDAVQAGRRVVATRVGDLGSLVERFGLGWVVPPEDPDLLAQALAQARAAPQPPLSEEARAFFHPGRAAERLLHSLGGSP